MEEKLLIFKIDNIQDFRSEANNRIELKKVSKGSELDKIHCVSLEGQFCKKKMIQQPSDIFSQPGRVPRQR